ncbi:MAG: LPS export ABC transporter periplasmic protein LptC, partial [Elusimicrobiales bacterium]|nr:LPS export ABC transporter periplasmic protein LptC [Elusimicrobiales bacterium]
KRNALFEDNVVSLFHNDNARMETAKLYYSPDKAFAWTDVPLKIIKENAQAANTAAAEKSSTTVTALRGQFFMGKRQATLEGNVVALEHRDNVRLETEKLYYSPGLVWTDEKVRITKENVPGLSARPESSGEAGRPAREIPPSVMTALRGRFDLEQNNATLEGSVVAESATERRRLETEKLHYSPPRELIWTDEAVKLTQGGTVVRGKGFEAKSDMSEITVRQQETQLSNQ